MVTLLVYSGQTSRTHGALLMFETGEKIKLSRPAGDFWKTNWGDRVEIREGPQVKIKTTSNILKVVNKLSANSM
jgi:hypothetical protein